MSIRGTNVLLTRILAWERWLLPQSSCHRGDSLTRDNVAKGVDFMHFKGAFGEFEHHARTERADLFIVCYRSAGTSVADLQTIYR